MNKFHARALHSLATKIASSDNGESVSATDRELLEYFAKLYKHANKGIKGRGKDVRVVGSASTYTHAAVMSMLGTRSGLNGNPSNSLTMSHNIPGGMHNYSMNMAGRQGVHNHSPHSYIVSEYDSDDASHRGSHSGGSSTTSIYGDHYDGFESRELAFGDRLY
jgi:hypothetical protein